MIPGKILRFLETRANIATAATRDRELVPHGHRVVGWRVGPDQETLTCLIPALFTTHLLEDLEDNGHFAVTIEEIPTHETYQLKGRYLRHRKAAGEDMVANARMRERFVAGLQVLRAEAPAAILGAFILEPTIALDIQVSEIYLQTPGPGAGTLLAPSAAAGRA